MTQKDEPMRDPLKGSEVMSTVATGGGGGVFQARVGALYLANMLTGVPLRCTENGSRHFDLRPATQAPTPTTSIASYATMSTPGFSSSSASEVSTLPLATKTSLMHCRGLGETS
jgi:hypothetical protein